MSEVNNLNTYKAHKKYNIMNYTYDVVFNDDNHSNHKGFKLSFTECKSYIKNHKDSYFEDYKGGTVSIVCNETGETIKEVEIL